jgi:hypothetical protein
MMKTEAKREQEPIIWYFLQIYNARPHLVQSKFDSMGIHRLPHSPYRPDIAPCDFWLFGYRKMKLEGIFFDTLVALSAEIEVILGDISIIEGVPVFDK